MPTTEQIERLVKLNADYRITIQGATFKENETTGKMQQTAVGGFTAEIVDKTVKVGYAMASDPEESKALDKAITLAENSPKPLTPAQQADVEANRIKDRQLSEKDAEINRLRAKCGEPPLEEHEPEPVPPPAAEPPKPTETIRRKRVMV